MGHLLRILGSAYGVAVALGATIGVGILRTPGQVAERLPGEGPIVLAWVVGGVFALLAAGPMAELAAAVPTAGGHFGFVRRGLGRYPAFVVGWFDFLSGSGGIAALSIAVADLAAVVWPPLRGHATPLALAVLGATVAVQFSGLRGSARTVGATSLIKTLGLAVFVLACWVMPLPPAAAPGLVTAASASGDALTLGAFAVALQSVVWTYDGWYGAVYLGEEMRDPGRGMPRAIFGTVLLVTVLYVLVNLSMLRVLSPQDMAGATLAVGAAATRLFGGGVDRAIAGFMIVSALSAIGALQIGTPRVLYALGREGLGPSLLTRVTPRGTPSGALLACSGVAALFIATGSFAEVLASVTPIIVSVLVLDIAAMMVLRRREPDMPRPFRAPGHPVTTFLALGCAFAFLLGVAQGDPEHTAVAAVLLAVSYPVYRAVRARPSRPPPA